MNEFSGENLTRTPITDHSVPVVILNPNTSPILTFSHLDPLQHFSLSWLIHNHTQPSYTTMSEVQSRPAAPRGRGSARGGRGGFSSRGGRGGRSSHAINGDKPDPIATSIEEDGEVAQLKKQYGSKVTTIKEMFPDWTDEDVVFALQETDGDLETTVDRITNGTCSHLLAEFFYTHSYITKSCRARVLTAQQVRSHNGARFRRPKRIDPDLRRRTQPLQPLETQPIKEKSHVVVDLA